MENLNLSEHLDKIIEALKLMEELPINKPKQKQKLSELSIADLLALRLNGLPYLQFRFNKTEISNQIEREIEKKIANIDWDS